MRWIFGAMFLLAANTAEFAASYAQSPEIPASLLSSAEQGNAKAQTTLGILYATGWGMPQDHKEALKWFRLAAEQGNAVAQVNLAFSYDFGQDVPQDHKEALKWFRLAAEQGYSKGQNGLGILYENGQGLPQDYKEAAKWFRLAAEKNFAMAQNNLGFLHEKGQGVPKDYVSAYKWFNLAGTTSVKEIANAAEKARDGIASLMSVDQIVEAQHFSSMWQMKKPGASDTSLTGYAQSPAIPASLLSSAEQGNAKAQTTLGLLYDKGQGVPKDYMEAMKWFRLAAAQDDAAAENNLGLLYENGQGLPQDYKEAAKWFRLAAEQGNAVAQNHLGILYENGQGVPNIYVYAYKWLNLAASSLDGSVADPAAKARDSVASRMTVGQLAEARQLSSVWQPKKPGALPANPADYAQSSALLAPLLSSAEQGFADSQFDLGNLYEKGLGVPKNYKEAAMWFRLAAEQANAMAESNLGFLCETGWGVLQDFKEAAMWFRLAAEQANATAQNILGFLYEKGLGVPKDYVSSYKWFSLAVGSSDKSVADLAAKQRDSVASRMTMDQIAEAQFGLGALHASGQGVPQDYKEAMKWFRLAAEEGNAAAQNHLGLLYENGDGVPKDYVFAYKWFNLAVGSSDKSVADLAAKQRDSVASRMTMDQIAEARHLSSVWQPKKPDTPAANPADYAQSSALLAPLLSSAEQGNAQAEYNLGALYASGRVVPRDSNYLDYMNAAMWFRLAAEQGYAKAQNYLGALYASGQGVPQDYKEAMKWFRRAAEQGEVTAQLNLGILYEKGQGVPQDYKEAAIWLRRAAEHGNTMAQNILGSLYDLGPPGVPQDYKEAAKWYRLAAELGDVQAQFDLGILYATGRVVPKDDKEAAKWYRRAAEQGNAMAQYSLGILYENGQGVPKDYVSAYKWLNLAGGSSDNHTAALAARQRDTVASWMTVDQIAEAQRLSSMWQPKKIAAPIVPPRPLTIAEGNHAPLYPLIALRKREQGRVVLRVEVRVDGRVDAVWVASSSGFSELDHAAIEAVRQWRFIPATQVGMPVAATAEVPINFTISN